MCGRPTAPGPDTLVLRNEVAVSSTDNDPRQQASPDKVAVGHAISRGLLVEICHLFLVQFVHVHLHVYTKRKAVRGQS